MTSGSADTIRIELEDGRLAYLPGERIGGVVQWDLAQAPDAIELRLFWYTAGKGTTDVEIVDSQRIGTPGRSGSRAFRFTLPQSPHSFSGRLISLVWGIEALAEPKGAAARVEFVMSPTGQEILLHAGDASGPESQE